MDQNDREGAFYRRLVETATEVTVVLDTEAVVRYVTPSVTSVLGYDPEAFLGDRIHEHLDPEGGDRVTDAIEAVRTGATDPVVVESRARRRDGTWRWLTMTIQNCLDDETLDGIVVTCKDATERVETEQRLRQQNELLGEFAGVVSHDLRSPITVARGRTTLLAETLDDADIEGVTEDIDTVLHALDRMDDIIEDTLTLARQGQPVSELEPIALVDVTRDSWEAVKTPDATLTVAADEARILADESRLRSVFENLFRNAIEHGSGSEPIAVTVDRIDQFHTSTRAPTDSDGFYVEDDGIGIPPADRADVFDPGHTSSNGGTGLGLSIVERVADAHGWDVRLDEGADGGARFTFTGVEFLD